MLTKLNIVLHSLRVGSLEFHISYTLSHVQSKRLGFLTFLAPDLAFFVLVDSLDYI